MNILPGFSLLESEGACPIINRLGALLLSNPILELNAPFFSGFAATLMNKTKKYSTGELPSCLNPCL